MTDPRTLQTGDYTYTLPEEKIAQHPLEERDASRLLIYRDEQITEATYRHISEHLPPGALLVFNDSKVIHARILFQKESGGILETFLLEPATALGYQQLAQTGIGTATWKCLIGGASKWKPGFVPQKRIDMEGQTVLLNATIVERNKDNFMIRFSWSLPELSFARILELSGAVPIPPYLKRGASSGDEDRYQTIYARQEGSVAAPTAGLHFTEPVFSSLRNKGIRTATLTLHVGAGTFLPVKATTLGQHTMHAEWILVERTFLGTLIHQDGPVFAVGTTSLRTLESMYWMGVRCYEDSGVPAEALEVGQWDAYDKKDEQLPDQKTALTALQEWMEKEELHTLSIRTKLLIAPPYRPRVASGLVTNFHQPGSTLLMLVAALTRNRWRALYDYALQNDFRFLSYGDGCLIYFD